MPSKSRKYSACDERRQRHAQSRAGRLVHLAEHHHRVGDDARLGHFQIEVVAFAGALADAAEHGVTAVLLGDVADQLHDEHGLADAGAAEESDLAAFGERREQVDGLQSCFELFRRGHLFLKRRRLPVNRQHVRVIHGAFAVDRVAEQIEHAAQRGRADGHGDRPASIDGFHAAHQTLRGRHGDRAHDVVAEVLGDFARQIDAARRVFDLDGLIDRRQFFSEKLDVHHRPDDLGDLAFAICIHG